MNGMDRRTRVSMGGAVARGPVEEPLLHVNVIATTTRRQSYRSLCTTLSMLAQQQQQLILVG